VTSGARLSASERAALLELARVAIEDAVRGESALAAAVARTEISERLREARGVFVCLKVPRDEAAGGGLALRGCIGTLGATRPLYEAVTDTAPRSALEDPRFPRLGVPELAGLRIEISVLTEPRPLNGLDALVIGRDGLQLEKDDRRAVFLPQVASEQRWDARTFAEHLALKAGLDRDGWRDATLSVFGAEVFGA
jgi:AmmeMemoRadiSam system protein A